MTVLYKECAMLAYEAMQWVAPMTIAVIAVLVARAFWRGQPPFKFKVKKPRRY